MGQAMRTPAIFGLGVLFALAIPHADAEGKGCPSGMASIDGAEKDPAKLAQAGQDAQQVVADYEEKLQALLGPEKKAKLDEYDRTLGDRMALQQYSGSFSAPASRATKRSARACSRS